MDSLSGADRTDVLNTVRKFSSLSYRQAATTPTEIDSTDDRNLAPFHDIAETSIDAI